MRIFFRYLSLFFLLLFPLAFAGCGDAPKTGEEKEIVLAAGRDLSPGEKDPYYSTVILKTWESLVGISDEGKVMPMLAESWESNAEKTEWIFHLKKGVKFHDGVSFDAHAARENFYRVTHMGYKPSSFYGYLVSRIYPGLVRYEADDDYTLHLYFERPVPMLIYRMAGWGSAMFSPASFDRETGDFTKIAAGTGPFQIIDRKADDYTLLSRFDGYHGEKAKAKRIRIRVITSAEARYSAMRSGEVQGVLDLGGLTPMMVRELMRTEDFSVDSAHSTISHYLSVNGGRFPFSDERMRRALDLAIYDPAEAKALAREVLGDARCEVKFLLPQYGAERYPYKVISEFLQAELKDLGLDVKIVMVDGLTSRKMMKEGDYDLAIGTRGLGNLDPTSLLREFFHSEGATNLASHFCYANPKIDAAFDALTHTYEIEDRQVLYHEIREELLLHPAVIPLLEDENLAVCSKKITGYHAAVYGITLDKVAWKE